MNIIQIPLLSIVLLISLSLQDRPVQNDTDTPSSEYDLVIYGGTPAGVAAAVQATRMGKKVALLEPTSTVGGIIVNGLGGTDIDNHREFQNSPAVGGFALEFYRKVAEHYGRLDEFNEKLKNRIKDGSIWKFEPHVAEKIMKTFLEENGVSVYLNTRLSEDKDNVLKMQRIIKHLKSENGHIFSARMFIDASLEGDLLAASGISTTWGRESNAKYGETKNGIRGETTYRQFEVKVDPYIQPGTPLSGLIPTVQGGELGIAGEEDQSIQAYCFRMCLSQDPKNRLDFQKPKVYKRNDYEIYLRYLKAGGKLYRPSPSIPNGKTDLGAWHDLSHNLYGMNHEYPEGNYETRQRIFDFHQSFTQGLFYFLAHDPEVGQLDSELQQAWKQWGLCKDEFTDNEGWPRQFYVRDARRMVSDYVITEHHIRRINPTPVPDPVAVAFWPPDLHSARRIVKDGYAYNEGFVFGGDDWLPFGISYRALVPKNTECENLLTPTCLSSSHVAYGAVRIEFTYMALGQACAISAVIAMDGSIPVQEVEYKLLKEKLLGTNQVIDPNLVGRPDVF